MRLLTTFLIYGFLLSQTAATPKFGAASIKPVPEGGSRPHLVDSPSGVEYPSIWMFDLVRRAWALRETSAYVLIPARNGPKLKSSRAAAGGLGFSPSPKGGERVSGNVGLDLLAQAIAPAMGRPVINQTGLTGVYEILVDYEPDNSGPGDPNLQHAIEDTPGLKLEYRKVPINVFVVDHLSKMPTDN